jgi:hypothetical protein
VPATGAAGLRQAVTPFPGSDSVRRQTDLTGDKPKPVQGYFLKLGHFQFELYNICQVLECLRGRKAGQNINNPLQILTVTRCKFAANPAQIRPFSSVDLT